MRDAHTSAEWTSDFLKKDNFSHSVSIYAPTVNQLMKQESCICAPDLKQFILTLINKNPFKDYEGRLIHGCTRNTPKMTRNQCNDSPTIPYVRSEAQMNKFGCVLSDREHSSSWHTHHPVSTCSDCSEDSSSVAIEMQSVPASSLGYVLEKKNYDSLQEFINGEFQKSLHYIFELNNKLINNVIQRISKKMENCNKFNEYVNDSNCKFEPSNEEPSKQLSQTTAASKKIIEDTLSIQDDFTLEYDCIRKANKKVITRDRFTRTCKCSFTVLMLGLLLTSIIGLSMYFTKGQKLLVAV